MPRRHAFAFRAAARVVRAWPPPGTLRFRADAADSQFDSAHPNGLEAVESLIRHTLRKVHESVILVDVDVSDESAIQVRLVRDGADDISGLDAVRMTDFDAVRFQRRALVRLVVPTAALDAGLASPAMASAPLAGSSWG